MAPLIGALTERAMKLLMAAWVADEFPPLSVLSAYQEQTRDTAARAAGVPTRGWRGAAAPSDRWRRVLRVFC